MIGSALAAGDGAVFATRPSRAEIVRIELGSGETTVMSRGCPATLTNSADGLVALGEDRAELLIGSEPVDFPLQPSIELRLQRSLESIERVAFWNSDVVILDAYSGSIDAATLVVDRTSVFPRIVATTATTLVGEGGTLPVPDSDRRIRSDDMALDPIRDITLVKGTAYVLASEPDGRESLWAIPLGQPVAIGTGKRVTPRQTLIARDDLLGFGEEQSGALELQHRPIPIEIRVSIAEADAVLAGVVSKLQAAGALGFRRIPRGESIHGDLRNAGIVVDRLDPIMMEVTCAANVDACQGATTESLWIPALSPERLLVVSEVELEGESTLYDVVRARVPSPEFNSWVSPFTISTLNPRSYKLAVVEERRGRFLVPEEIVRIFVAVPRTQIEELLYTIKKAHPSMRITILDRTQPKLSQAQGIPTECEGGAELSERCRLKLKQLFEDAMRTINHQSSSGHRLPPSIGIAESSDVYCDHPDFLSDAGTPCVRIRPASSPAAIGLANLGSGPAGATSAPARVRRAADLDHPVMVASVIGARKTRLETRGLSPRSRLVPILSSVPDIETDIEQAFLSKGVNLFNMSFAFETPHPSLEDPIDTYRTGALFVAAAGNAGAGQQGQELCVPAGERYYPACFGDRSNVLVVAAATADGTALRNDSHWSRKFVHVAAPGEGFFVSANGGSYALVEGTSFAAPIVTGLAAHLMMLGYDEPAQIKHRIIATSDPNNNLDGKVMGGLVNAARAMNAPQLSILEQNGREWTAQVDAQNQVGRFTENGSQRVVFLANILRLTYSPGTDSYRIAYLESDTGPYRDLSGVRPSDSDWTVRAWPADASGVAASPQDVNLLELEDYVGPIH